MAAEFYFVVFEDNFKDGDDNALTQLGSSGSDAETVHDAGSSRSEPTAQWITHAS